MSRIELRIDPERILGPVDPKVYGHFVEHFHRQVYGGIYEPGSPLADASGLRTDVAAALKAIRASVLRWPGGCFASAYHWKDGIGKDRACAFDKAWRVEESNAFGTDEFMAFCAATGAEPYVCANAGTGSPEEMSDWVEYCNLRSEGTWARERIANGRAEPYGVRYWSIGNENYLGGEMGSKTAGEWCRYVKEAAKMMKRVDPSIELLAASVADFDWNRLLLQEAGGLLDWISIHGYWDPVWGTNALGPYEKCMAYATRIEEPIRRARHVLGALGFLGKVRVAYDEWNLRGWYHPFVDTALEAADCVRPRDDNDLNASYTMADAVFSACFLNSCIRNGDLVGMANFAPSVNARGMIFAHPGGIVLRSTYFAFKAYAQGMLGTAVDSYLVGDEGFDVSSQGVEARPGLVDAAATRDEEGRALGVSLVNRHPDRTVQVAIRLRGGPAYAEASVLRVRAASKDSYNDVGRSEVSIEAETLALPPRGDLVVELPPHSISVLGLRA